MNRNKLIARDKEKFKNILLVLPLVLIIALPLLLLTPLGVISSCLIASIPAVLITITLNMKWDKKNGYEWRYSKEYKNRVNNIKNKYKFKETLLDRLFKIFTMVVLACTIVVTIMYDIIDKYNNDATTLWYTTFIMLVASAILTIIMSAKENEIYREITDIDNSMMQY